MTASPRTKAAKREARRRRNQADRAAALRLKVPATIGLVAAAEMAVEEEADERERRDAKRRAQRGFADRWPIDVYREKGELTGQQHSDAERIRDDWARSGLSPKASGIEGGFSRSAPSLPGGGPGYAPYMAAMRAVGIIMSPVLVDVVLGGQTAEAWAADRDLPAKDGLKALRAALDMLGAHYRGRAL